MALTLHIAPSECEAARVACAASFDETLHRQLFARGLLGPDECPLLQRISDPCADAAYRADEAERFASEAETVAGRVNPMLAAQLRDLASVARRAAAAGLNLYAFAD